MNRTDRWRLQARQRLLAERDLAPWTPLREFRLPHGEGRLFFKDESVHSTGSLKHRLARSLVLQGIERRAIGPGTPLFDASSGNTAISEARFAQLLELPYFAVIPEGTSPGKQALIRNYGGDCITVPAGVCCKTVAARRAAEQGGYFLDQFTNAATATDWRDNNVISELLEQLQAEDVAAPDWFVMGAGTGGTSAGAARCFRYNNLAARVLVVDPEDSAFYSHYACTARGCLCASRVEGIGRPQVEPSFDSEAVDRMLVVPDAASFAAARWLATQFGKSVGVSTGSNLVGAITLLKEHPDAQVATLICDDGRRYAGRLDNDEWLAAQGLEIGPWIDALDHWACNGEWQPPVQSFASCSRICA